MLGAIIGDIVGSRWEFNPTNDYDFEMFSQENSFTDDTVCTVAVADAIAKGRDYGESIHEWCRRYPSPMGGYGGRFRQWVMSDDPKPYGSFGSGSAMRVSPVAWHFNTAEDVLREARLTAECTHNHPEGIRGAEATTLAISLGADADTLGAIVGSIAEARWVIPDAIRQKVMEYLPEEMQNVILSMK